MRTRIGVVLAALVVSVNASGCVDAVEPSDGPVSCLRLIRALDVEDESRAGYDRDLFADDYDRDALLVDSLNEHGAYVSLYDGRTYDDPEAVDVDHTVSLAEAWDSGAGSWSQLRRDRFSVDELNLTLLTRDVNRDDKGDGDVTEWVPPDPDAVAEFVIRYVLVKYRYDLAVDTRERVTLANLADGVTCGTG